MPNQKEKVSIIVNCYNGEEFLDEALRSIKNQTYQNFEIIFFDNCSTDRSAEIARKYEPKLKYFKSDKNISLGEARKKAMAYANGDWIAILDVDDYWFDDLLEISLNSLISSEYVMSYAGIKEIDVDGNYLREMIPVHKSGFQLEEQLSFFEINMQTPVISRRFLLDNDLNFNPNMITSEDFNLFIRIAAKGPIKVLKKPLAAYRVHNSMTNKRIDSWYLDHQITLTELLKENPLLKENYKLPLLKAESKAKYYHARYLFSKNEKSEAREIMKSIKTVSFVYLVLWVISFSSLFWKIMHSDIVKRSLSKTIGIFMVRES